MKLIVIAILTGALLTSPMTYAQGSVVGPQELKQALVDSAAARQANLKTVREFFSSPQAREALQSAHIDEEFITKGVATLSATDLAKVAARVQKTQSDFAAGSLTNQQLTYVVIALGTAVVIILIVR